MRYSNAMGSPLFARIMHGADPRMFGAKCESIWFLFSICERCGYSTPYRALVGTLTPWERVM